MKNLALGNIHYGQIITSIYLKVSISDFLTLFSARTGENYFWSSRPAPILMYACCFSLSLSTLIACVWPNSFPDNIETEGILTSPDNNALLFWIWFYCILWWILQDIIKVWTWRFMKDHNYMNVNNTGKVVYSARTLVKMNSMREELSVKYGTPGAHHV